MDQAALRGVIEAAFETPRRSGRRTGGEVREAVEAALDGLDRGELRVAEKGPAGWTVNQWLKKAVLLSFRLNDMAVIAGRRRAAPPGGTRCRRSSPAGARTASATPASAPCPAASCAAPPTSRPGVVLMPCFVNLGAYVDSGTMVDTWATVGSCAQIGKNCHISGGAGIGGVLEPLQAGPVVIEDNCFIGARAEVAEGVHRRARARCCRWASISAPRPRSSTARRARCFQGRVPPYSVVVSGTLPGKPLPDGTPGPGLYCAVIVKRVDARTRSKTSINELLRD